MYFLIFFINVISACFVCGSDWNTRTIPNRIIMLIFAINIVNGYISDYIFQSLFFSLLLCSILFILWLFDVLGGGDVKLLFAFSVGITPDLILYNYLFTFLLGGVLAAFMYVFLKKPFERGIPYGLPICVSSLFFIGVSILI
ncbi:prepilin peptidase [Vibrio parahaemolyticus]|uniref:A24 family peptidase n=1 Tax=Vibrio parahaemolyticus TaxID=670 RepID=UPI001EEB146D|nr:prepilin peptidase [Vibrio parahaemolyticus]MCG6461809.1 prepilin peptidase [Vibrio parahaemolyticus]